MNRQHIVKSFDEEIEILKSKVAHMADEVSVQLTKAIQALTSGDTELAQLVVEGDHAVNRLQMDIDDYTVNLLARRQPLAQDLRSIVTTSKIAAELERVADYASSISKHVSTLKDPLLEAPVKSFVTMGSISKEMLTTAIQSYLNADEELARKTWCRDEAINALYEELLLQLEKIMLEQPSSIKMCTRLLFVGRCCERIGDHIKNIAENVHYIARGELMHPGNCR